jgi:hypothetical protein
MQTLDFDLTADSWEEILGHNNSIGLQLKTSNNVRLHFNDSDTAPALDAPHFLIQSWPPRFDFECQSQGGQARVWARADRAPASVVVIRRTA